MTTPTILIFILIILWAGYSLVFQRERLRRRLTPLAGLAFACVVAAVVFQEKQAIHYSFLAAGILLAVIDMILRVMRK